MANGRRSWRLIGALAIMLVWGMAQGFQQAYGESFTELPSASTKKELKDKAIKASHQILDLHYFNEPAPSKKRNLTALALAALAYEVATAATEAGVISDILADLVKALELQYALSCSQSGYSFNHLLCQNLLSLSHINDMAINDLIEEIVIIRKGGDARKFDAPEIFSTYFSEKDEIAKEKEAKQAVIKEKNVARFDKQKENATTTKSGLQYLVTSKGNGAAVTTTNKTNVHYAVYFEDGTLLETSMEEVAAANNTLNIQRQNAGKYLPIEASVGEDAGMIEGFKEGLRLLKQGDKATLFLPYTIAYGATGGQGIPPQTDLIFEVEIVNVIK